MSGILAALLVACAPLSPVGPGEGPDRPTVEVGLSLSVAPLDADVPDTKTDFDPDDPGYDKDAAVASVAVLQFEWQDAETASAARLVNQQYIPSYDPAVSRLPLVASDTKNTIVVVANVPGKLPVPLNTSFGSFLKNYNYSLLDSLTDVQGDGLWWRPVGSGNRYLRMNGSDVVDAVTAGTLDVDVALKRSCAKVVVKVTNTASASGVTVEKVQLRDVNRRYHQLTNLSSVLRDGETPLQLPDPFDVELPMRFDDAEQPAGADYPAEGNAGVTQTFTYFVPANLRGTKEEVVEDPAHPEQSQYRKNWFAPAGATCFCIYAKDAAGLGITYTYYLGRNLTTDYNLEPNRKYVYHFNITSRGDADKDSRIEDLSEFRYAVDANCYLAQPPSRAGQSRVYAFPLRRAEVFWNKAGVGAGVYGAAVDNTGTLQDVYALGDDTEWTAEVVWQQIKNYTSDADFLLTTEGRGFVPDFDSGAGCLKVKVTAGMRGSALVAVRKKTAPTENDILWSWHIWVTDYAPDTPVTVQDGTYVYPVPGGSVQRYNNIFWRTGDYAQAVVMDRHLGARSFIGSGSGVGVNDSYGYFYYWGRKDPFRDFSSYARKGDAALGGAPYWLVRYSIHNPSRLIIGESGSADWTNLDPATGDNMADKSKNWLDPKIDSHGIDIDHCEAGKSIYDPCPPGWQVPNMSREKTGNSNGNFYQGFNTSTLKVDGDRYGVYYYPEGIANAAATGYAFFPLQGSSYNSMLRLDGPGEWDALLSAYWNSLVQTSQVRPNENGRNYLGNVRCVKLNLP